jgi:hypothetical protein
LEDPQLAEDGYDTIGPSLIDPAGTPVCMDCRSDEAQRIAAGARDIPAAEWPIREGAHDYLASFELDPDRH